MRLTAIAIAFFALVAATATPTSAVPKLIYRVDSVTAKTVKNHLVVTAKGAVTSGGWTRPRLHLSPVHIPESAVETIQFLASPPLDNAVVIQALLPISATAVFPLPHYATVKVTVVTETNSITAPIQ